MFVAVRGNLMFNRTQRAHFILSHPPLIERGLCPVRSSQGERSPAADLSAPTVFSATVHRSIVAEDPVIEYYAAHISRRPGTETSRSRTTIHSRAQAGRVSQQEP